MNQLDNRRQGIGSTLVGGTVIGGVAWMIGYGIVYLLVAGDVRESSLHRIIEAIDGEPAVYEMVGWVFYNTHFVDVAYRDVPLLGSGSMSTIGGDGLSMFLVTIPMITLTIAGFAVGRFRHLSNMAHGTIAGLSIVPGYLVGSVAGLIVFRVTIGSATASPDPVSAIVLAGLMFPLVFGGLGGTIAAAGEW